MRREVVVDVAGAAMLGALVLWLVWPRQTGESISFRRGAFPSSTHDARNVFMSVFILAWLTWQIAEYRGVALMFLGLTVGTSALFWAIMWFSKWIAKHRASTRND